MFDHEEAVERLEGYGRDGEEVDCDNHLAVISEKRQPPLTRVTTALDTPKISGNGPFRDDEAEFQKLSVDLGCAPACILFRQASDQQTNLGGDLRSAAARAGAPAPVESVAGAMPADDRFRSHDD